MNFLKIKAIAAELDLKNVIYDCDTSKLCSIGAGGKAAALITIDDVKKLLMLIKVFEKNAIKYIILGGGTNIVFGGGRMEYALIKMGESFKGIQMKPEKKIEAGAGAGTANLVMKTAKNGSDLSFLAGIPGTIGGAVYGNSGTAGKWIAGSIETIKYICKNGDQISLTECSGREIGSGYRYMDIPGLLAIVSVVLKPETNEPQAILSKINANINKRKSSQPMGSETCGCFFKNPAGTDMSAGALIEGCGLKGFMYGGAMVSPVHANFIENFNDATSRDIMVLSRIIKSKVKEKYDIGLDYEVKLIE